MADKELGERIARLEGMLESHEKNAIERKASIEKKFDIIFSKLDGQNCTLHAARMLELKQDVDGVIKDNEKFEKETNGRLRFLEKVIWTSTGGLTVLVFVLKFLIK